MSKNPENLVIGLVRYEIIGLVKKRNSSSIIQWNISLCGWQAWQANKIK